MDQIVNFTVEKLEELKNELTVELAKMKGKTNKKKMKLIGKSVLKFFLIAGGVTVAIFFPSTVVIAVLGGIVAFLDGRAIKSIKKFRENQNKRKSGKDDLKGVETEITKKKTVREYLQQQAPPLYPRA